MSNKVQVIIEIPDGYELAESEVRYPKTGEWYLTPRGHPEVSIAGKDFDCYKYPILKKKQETMTPPKTFTEIKDAFERNGGSDSGTDRALRIAMRETLDLLALFLPPQEVIDNTEQVEQLDSAILSAVEYGYQCCERGMNLRATLIEAKARTTCQ